MPKTPTAPSKETADRRSARTREALRNALLSLLGERGWDDIQVQSLCDRANIGRSTFYLHYPNKDELLKGSFGELRDMLLQGQPVDGTARAAPGGLVFVAGLIEHVHEQQQVFRALLGRRSGHHVQERFRELLVNMAETEMTQGSQVDWRTSAHAHALGGALFQLLVWWLGANRPHSAQEIEALFQEISDPLLNPARRATAGSPESSRTA